MDKDPYCSDNDWEARLHAAIDKTEEKAIGLDHLHKVEEVLDVPPGTVMFFTTAVPPDRDPKDTEVALLKECYRVIKKGISEEQVRSLIYYFRLFVPPETEAKVAAK